MANQNQPMLGDVDWSVIPAPEDDGAADHLTGMALPNVTLPSTGGQSVTLSKLEGTVIIFAYPMTGRPDVALPNGWDDIPGARGCTPQSCSFRDLHRELISAGADQIFGLSTQSTDYQREAVERLHLPFDMLSDSGGELRQSLQLPTMEVEKTILLRRLSLICTDGRIRKVFYPVFPPDRSAADVLDWLSE